MSKQYRGNLVIELDDKYGVARTEGELELMIADINALLSPCGYRVKMYGERAAVRNGYAREVATAVLDSVMNTPLLGS